MAPPIYTEQSKKTQHNIISAYFLLFHIIMESIRKSIYLLHVLTQSRLNRILLTLVFQWCSNKQGPFWKEKKSVAPTTVARASTDACVHKTESCKMCLYCILGDI